MSRKFALYQHLSWLANIVFELLAKISGSRLSAPTPPLAQFHLSSSSHLPFPKQCHSGKYGGPKKVFHRLRSLLQPPELATPPKLAAASKTPSLHACTPSRPPYPHRSPDIASISPDLQINSPPRRLAYMTSRPPQPLDLHASTISRPPDLQTSRPPPRAPHPQVQSSGKSRSGPGSVIIGRS